jgi:hypothetical protein
MTFAARIHDRSTDRARRLAEHRRRLLSGLDLVLAEAPRVPLRGASPLGRRAIQGIALER